MKPASFDTAEWIDAWRDRRPMTDDEVLVSYFFDGKMRVSTSFYAKESRNPISVCCEGWACAGTVLAWMPLPEAYDPVAAYEADKRYEQIVFKKDESGKVVSVEW